MRLSKLLLCACLGLASLPGWAQTVNNLYQVREPVSSQSPQERDRATQAALQTLIVRLTGNSKAAQGEALAAVRQDPQQVISQYGYEGSSPEVLLVDFDPASTDRRLQQAGLAIWGSNRPSIMGWWLLDATEGSNLVGDAQSAAEPLRRAAEHRGLPLILPLADLSEQGVGTAENLESTDVTPLKEASERYGADAVLAVHAREDGGQWQGKWRLWLGDQREQGTASGASVQEMADAVLLAVTERLAPRFAIKPGATAAAVQVQIGGMNLERYAQLLRLLEPMGGRLVAVQGETITFQASASAEQVRNQLGLARLQEVPASEVAPVEPTAPVAADAPPAAGTATPGTATPGTAAPGVAAPTSTPPPASTPTLYFRWG